MTDQSLERSRFHVTEETEPFIFDIDDVILNAFGVMVGYGVFVMFKRRAEPCLG